MYGGIALEVLEDVVREMNRHLDEKITYNVSSSTPAKDVYTFMQEGDLNSNLDCMICITWFYNKQRHQGQRPPKLVNDRALAHDYLHNVLERPRQLSNYDVCLKCTDGDWHRPLLVRIHAYHMRNWRTRGPVSQKTNRFEAQWKRQEREEPTYGRNTGGYHRQDSGPSMTLVLTSK